MRIRSTGARDFYGAPGRAEQTFSALSPSEHRDERTATLLMNFTIVAEIMRADGRVGYIHTENTRGPFVSAGAFLIVIGP